MDNVWSRTGSRAPAASGLLSEVRAVEWVIAAFFVYVGASACTRPIPVSHRALLFLTPLALIQIWRFESARSRPWSRVVRDWSTLALIPVGYWAVGWLATGRYQAWETEWLSWDRTILNGLGFRSAIESAGAFFPALLETLYLLLYSFPPICLGFIYAYGNRRGIHKFLLILFLGTFTAYAMLPVFPVESPRLAFPGVEPPSYASMSRQINTWILDHLDIATSVFPSGHVAVAFSCAFGLFSVLRKRRLVWSIAFCAALAIYAATIYGRYHYATDGLASFIIAFMSWRVIELVPADT